MMGERRDVSNWVCKKMSELRKDAKQSGDLFTGDEWLIGAAPGRDGKVRTYIYHMAFPRFVARVIDLDQNGEVYPEDQPADLGSGRVYIDGDRRIFSFTWFEQVYDGGFQPLLDAASAAIDRLEDLESDLD